MLCLESSDEEDMAPPSKSMVVLPNSTTPLGFKPFADSAKKEYTMKDMRCAEQDKCCISVSIDNIDCQSCDSTHRTSVLSSNVESDEVNSSGANHHLEMEKYSENL
jgi:hypothetical protein